MKVCADFETTTVVDDCRVWAWGICDIDTYEFEYGNTIEGFFEWCRKHAPVQIYFHNLKFDGEFILNWILRNGFTWTNNKKLETKEFSTIISDQNLFYNINIRFAPRKMIKIYDSLKIIPMSIEAMAKAFDLPIEKEEITYTETREPGHILTDQEVLYLHNDVEIPARALHLMFSQGLTKMTCASNALNDYKEIMGKQLFQNYYPAPVYDADIRQAYKGGFTYLNPKYKGKMVGKGIVLDFNSLYPSVMYYCDLPHHEGKFFQGQYQHDRIYPLYIQMLRCEFEIKPGHIPTIQLKNSLLFRPNEYVTSSHGEEITLCLTSVDLELFFEQYDVYNVEYLSGWKFRKGNNLFREYIDKWYGIKAQATLDGNKGMRTLAKLMQNSLYGKFAKNPCMRSKMPYLDERGIVKYKELPPNDVKPLYIPVAAFITAYGRAKTIRAAQSCYDRYIYSDTDSIHLEGWEVPEGLEIDPVKLGALDLESKFTRGKFLRQKTYMEEIDGEVKITCAGMPAECYKNVTFENFQEGATFSGKLMPKHCAGGIVLEETDFTIKFE